jgi:iron complex transport system permease protein
LLVWAADQIVQAIGTLTGAELPAGMLTGLLGAPLMLVLLPRLHERHVDLNEDLPSRRRMPAGPLLALSLLAIVAVTLALIAGQGVSGWWWAASGELVLNWRTPRVAASFAAGAALALAGMIMQRMTGNAMASPELLGVSSGAALGMVLVVLLVPELDRAVLLGGAAMGALLVLQAIFLLGRRSSLSPERLLLTGVAVTTIVATLSSMVMLSGHPRLDLLLRMVSGSTYLVSAQEAAATVLVASAGIGLVFLTARSLAILPLGQAAATALGLAIGRSRMVLLLIASLLTGAATLVVGPLSFVGLVAPHLVRMIGLAGPAAQGIGSALAGGILMALADWVGRNIAFPWQIPAGLLAALVCCPYFLWLVARRRTG